LTTSRTTDAGRGLATYSDYFSGAAASYAMHRPTYPATLFTALASLAPSTTKAWDCATGTGQAALRLAESFATVEATDASVEQIQCATPHPRVRYAVAPAEASGLPDASCDLISVAQALHWFDLPRFYAEAHRVLKPQGILAAYGYAWFYIAPEIDAVVDAALRRPLDDFWPAQNALLWHGYRTIEFPFQELRAPRLAIHLRWTLQQLLDYYLTWSAVRQRVKQHGDGFLATVRSEMGKVWGDPTAPRAVVMPLTIRLGRGP
jgi:SAM-dependent methyltransferase